MADITPLGTLAPAQYRGNWASELTKSAMGFLLSGKNQGCTPTICAALRSWAACRACLTFGWARRAGLAIGQLNFQKDSFNKDHTNQVQSTNTQLQDRQVARVASNPGVCQSVADYMSQHGLK